MAVKIPNVRWSGFGVFNQNQGNPGELRTVGQFVILYGKLL